MAGALTRVETRSEVSRRMEVLNMRLRVDSVNTIQHAYNKNLQPNLASFNQTNRIMLEEQFIDIKI